MSELGVSFAPTRPDRKARLELLVVVMCLAGLAAIVVLSFAVAFFGPWASLRETAEGGLSPLAPVVSPWPLPRP